jgi:hypothetical protein
LGQNFYIHSGNLVAFAESDILKLIWLESMINAIQFTNIQNGIWFIKLIKNQKVHVIDFSIKFRTWIQFDCKAMYGPMMKLKTVMGIRIMKYSFSVLVRVL